LRVTLGMLTKRFASSSNVAVFTGALNAAVPREAKSMGSGGLEDPPQRPTVATTDPGDPMRRPLSKAARSRLSGLGVTISESEPEAWLRSSPETI
jgi:hypothetical protein